MHTIKTLIYGLQRIIEQMGQGSRHSVEPDELVYVNCMHVARNSTYFAKTAVPITYKKKSV